MAESDATRENRQVLAGAVKKYRESLYDDPSKEKDVARDVAEEFGVTQKDLRERAEAGA